LEQENEKKILLITIASILSSENIQLQEISLDNFLDDYLPDHKILKRVQMEGICRDFAVAEETGDIVAITEMN